MEEWKDIYNARVYPKERIVALSNSWRTVLRLHCLAENLDQVADQAQKCARVGALWQKRHYEPVRHCWDFYALWTGSALVATLATPYWPES